MKTIKELKHKQCFVDSEEDCVSCAKTEALKDVLGLINELKEKGMPYRNGILDKVKARIKG